LKFAAEVAALGTHPRLRDKAASLPAGGSADAFFGATRSEIARQSRGLPAPGRCVDAVEAAVSLPFDEGLARERGFFIELVQSPESKALRHAFFAERAAAKIPDVPESTATRSIRKAAVLGFGTMGGGCAIWKVIVVSQLFASLMVTLQGPAQSPLTAEVPCPKGGAGDQVKV
jgi:3-hydroxyacyl-CoA dehydrogenase